MRFKRFFSLLNAALFPFFLEATLASNPSTPEILETGFIIKDTNFVNFRLGMEGQSIRDERLKFVKEDRDLFFHLPRFGGWRNLWSFTLNIIERADLYGMMGEEQAKISFFLGNNFLQMQSDPRFIGRTGGRLVLVQRKNFTLGAEGNYLWFHTRIKRMLQNGHPLSDQPTFLFKGWQVSVGASYKIGWFIPYIGAVVRDMKWHFKHFPLVEKKLELVTRHKAGLSLGVTLSPGDKIFLNTELRCINESSWGSSLELRF
jgi:hypothetical protein